MNPPCRVTLNNLCRYSTLEERSILPTLHGGPHIGTSSQRAQYGKDIGKKSNFTMGKSDNHYLSQVTKVIINCDKSYC